MRLTREAEEPRYFWSGWFTQTPLGTLAVTFILLSLADLVATLRLMPAGILEGNRLALDMLKLHGAVGMVVYKLALVFFVLLVVWLIQRRRPALARSVLWAGNLVMALVALRHLAIIAVW